MPLISTDRTVRIALVLIATILSFTALKYGKDFFAPLFLALVTGVVLGPLTDALRRIGLPNALSAILVLSFGIASITLLAFLAEPLIWRIVDELPKLKLELRSVVAEFRDVIRGLDEVNEEVEQALGTNNGDKDTAEPTPMPTLTDALFLAPLLAAHFMIFAGSLFFFLLTRENIYNWTSRFIGRGDHDVILHRLGQAEAKVSRYVLTISVINIGLGTSLAMALWALALPAPFVWGVVATLLNFILYLGPLVVACGLLLAGLIAFDGLMVVVPPLIFLGLNLIEAQVVTPSLVGKHVSVNPLLVFVSLLFWLWLWGPIGGIIAIPVLVIVMVMLNLFEDLPEEEEAAG